MIYSIIISTIFFNLYIKVNEVLFYSTIICIFILNRTFATQTSKINCYVKSWLYYA